MKKSNKGFTLVEIIVALCVFAIVVAPLLYSFTVSHNMNIKSRRMMAANDVAQTIMEGFSDKSYADIRDALEGGLAAGSVSLCSISQNHFNVSDNIVKITPTDHVMESCNIDQLWYYTEAGTKEQVSANSLVSGNNASNFSGYDLCRFMEIQSLRNIGDGAKLYYAITPDGNAAMMSYVGIIDGNYKFNVDVCFYPVTSVSTNKYYSYGVSIAVYDYVEDITGLESELAAGGSETHKPVVKMVGGMRAAK